MPRNPRPASRGIGGRHAAESVAGIRRNTHIWARGGGTHTRIKQQTTSHYGVHYNVVLTAHI